MIGFYISFIDKNILVSLLIKVFKFHISEGMASEI
jgi:hypothetical protein